MTGVFVTGTDTGAGKTVLSAALVAAIAAAGKPAAAHKPVLTGLDEPPDPLWPRDHELLGSLCGMSPEEVAPLCFAPPASPHLAAELAGARLDGQELLSRARAALHGRDGEPRSTVVEGVGGLLVPFAEDFDVRDLAAGLGLPVVIAARSGLGTINHTLLTIEAARAAGLQVAAVVLGQWPAEPGELELSNRATIERRGRVSVHTLARLAGPDPEMLAAAGERLPWRRWLQGVS